MPDFATWNARYLNKAAYSPVTMVLAWVTTVVVGVYCLSLIFQLIGMAIDWFTEKDYTFPVSDYIFK